MSKRTEIFPVKRLLRLTEEQAARITDFRYEQRVPSDNEAMRQLIEMGLRAHEDRKKKPTANG
ncbi:MAG: hypothetical protein HC869_13200 [Rhodospirillales bacterium]|nr:hypothetical protein [Rhodospirillales bacterium]